MWVTPALNTPKKTGRSESRLLWQPLVCWVGEMDFKALPRKGVLRTKWRSWRAGLTQCGLVTFVFQRCNLAFGSVFLKNTPLHVNRKVEDSLCRVVQKVCVNRISFCSSTNQKNVLRIIYLHFYEQLILIVTGFVVASKVSLLATPTFTCYPFTKPRLYVIKLKEECLISNTWPSTAVVSMDASFGEVFITERPEIQPCFWSKIAWGFPLPQAPKPERFQQGHRGRIASDLTARRTTCCGGCERFFFFCNQNKFTFQP